MSAEHLRRMLENLHAELQTAESVDERSRELLREVDADIQNLLERSDAEKGESLERCACASSRSVIPRSPRRSAGCSTRSRRWASEHGRGGGSPAKARALLRTSDAGVLSTQSLAMAGYPFGSLAPFAMTTRVDRCST